MGIHTHTLLMLCIKWVTNENILYRAGNSTQRSALTGKGTKAGREEIHTG